MHKRMVSGLAAFVALSVALGVSLGLVFSGSGPATAPASEPLASLTPSDGGSAPASAVAPEATQGSGGGPSEGISVHGHWKINVLEPDGHLVSSHEFENALDNDGKLLLAQLLTTERQTGQWRVDLQGTGVGGSGQPIPDSPCGQDSGPLSCKIMELTATPNSGCCFSSS